MKKINFTLCLVIVIATYQFTSAQTKSCCSTHSNDAFAALGTNAQFQSAHAAPVPINFHPSKGTMISFDTPDGKPGRAFAVGNPTMSNKYLFIFHEWWGLNDHIKREAERFADEFPGVNIMALDLYDGQITSNADSAGKIMQTIRKERAEAIIKGALEHVGPSAQIQTIGWCFGGGWSLQAALMAGNRLKGCVIYYGMPENDTKRLETLYAPVLGIYASKDNWINKPLIEEFEKKMKALNKPFTVHWFDADHAFANPSNPQFDQVATAKAHSLAVEFLRNNFSK